MFQEWESINDYFRDDSKFIGEFPMTDYKVMRGYIGGYGDELRLYYTKFDPPTKKASLCIIHGFGEHQGRFLHVADQFAKLNFSVHLIDLRGFGYSGGPRGSQTLKQLHMDIEVLLRQVSKDLPLFLYGHAMGGLLVISFLLRNPQLKVSGVFTTAPMLGFPLDRRLKGIKYIAVKYFGQYMEDLVINTKLNITGLSKNDQHIQRCFEEKLMMPLLGVGMAQSILETLNYVDSNAQHFRFPILLLHGKLDTVSSYQESVRFYEKCGSQDKAIKLFELGYHELQHDLEFQEIKELIGNWCNEKLKKAQPFGIQFNEIRHPDVIKITLWYTYLEEQQIQIVLDILCRSIVFIYNLEIQTEISEVLVTIYTYYDNLQIFQQKIMRNFRGNNQRSSNRPFRGDRRQRGDGQQFRRRKFSRENSDQFSKKRFGFKKSGKFNSFRTGRRRFQNKESREGDLQNRLDKQLEQYKSGQQVGGNHATSRLDNDLDAYFSRKGASMNALDKDLEKYWKKNN